MKDILFKSWNCEKLNNGSFGNTLEMFKTPPDDKTTFCIRYASPLGGGGKFAEHLMRKETIDTMDEWKSQGLDKSRMSITRANNVEKTILIQGEVTRAAGGLFLCYSTLHHKMRRALRLGGVDVCGLKAKMILQSNLDPSSYDCLMDLLDLYSEHVVEFSTYSKHYGKILSRNTIFWEVRKY